MSTISKSQRLWILSAAVVVVVGGVSLAKPITSARTISGRPTARAPQAAAIAPAPPVLASRPNPLLPRQIDISSLFPAMMPAQNEPQIAPAGIRPLYTRADWNEYAKILAREQTDSAQRRVAAGNELAARLIADAEIEKRPGVRRLLLVRAVAMTYRNSGGWAQAGKALESFQRTLDVNDAAQLAALWTMADTLSKYSTTPRPERINCSAIAAKANVQLSLMLMEWGQMDAAQSLIKKAAYHEGWLKNDAKTRGQIQAARSTINSTYNMMEYLRTQYDAVVANRDEAAAFRIYLFARFARPSPGIAADLETRRNARQTRELKAALEEADRNPPSAYAAAKTLQDAAAALPDGMLKHRVMYAAMHYYKVYMRDASTEGDRIKRTLAQMQIQNLASDGARGPVAIKPFETAAPQATGAAPHIPAHLVPAAPASGSRVQPVG